MKEQYFPNWYLSKKDKEYRKNLQKISILLIAFIIISSINIFEGIKDLNSYTDKMAVATKLNKKEDNTFEIYYSYNYLYDILKEANVELKKLSIDYGDIYVEIYAKDMKEYKSKLDILETKFVIEEITPLSNEEDKNYFSIRMKIYEN